MTDFDPDAYLSQQTNQGAFDPDAYLSDPSAGKSDSKARTEKSQTWESTRNPINQFVAGAFRTGISGVAGTVAGGLHGLLDVVTGKGVDTAAADVGKTAANVAYQPRNGAEAAGAKAATSQWNPANWPGLALGYTGKKLGGAAESLGASPGVSTALEVAPTAAAMLYSPVKNAMQRDWSPYTVDAEQAPLTAQETVSRAAQQSPQSMGAASAAPRLTQVSPELQQAVVNTARQTGGAVNPEVLARHIEADSLPVKIQLTPGQALQDPVTISQEMNNRARTPGLPELLNRQNKALTENIQAIRDQVGPDVFSTNHVEHGEALIEAYKAKDEPIRADISAKYQALKEANGGEFPVDGQQFVANADRALKSNMKRPFLPAGVESTLQEFRNGESMTFENFENLRTTLASEARKAERSGDGNAAAAVNLVREQLEKLPMSDVAAPVKALADQARSAARARFDALKADPAYKAAVEDSVAPDDFVRKFVINGKRDDVALMRQNLKDNPTATQTMSVAVLDHLRRAAGIDDMGNGTFSQAGYNKALQALGPKTRSLLDPRTTESLETLGNVARYTQAQPKGSYVNNSNTLVGALGEHAMNAGENLLNAKTGIGGTLLRKAVENRSAKKAAQQTMTPYGGLDRLPEVEK